MADIPEVKLHDGAEIPVIGFGTSRLRGIDGVTAITTAITNGYRLIDSAYNYENEGTVGEAIRRSNVPREHLKITSKLPGRYQRYEDAVKAIQESLFRAQLDYFDLYLIHWPNPKQGHYVEAWQALIDAQKWGLIRSIGVSNFLPEHLEHLEKETGVLPVINQVELHPFFNQQEQREWHDKHQIITQSWSPLSRAQDVFENETIQSIAAKYNKTTSQIILRWHYQIGAVSIPKSTSREHQLSNISIFDFELQPQDMETLLNLSQPDGRLLDQDPAVYEEF